MMAAYYLTWVCFTLLLLGDDLRTGIAARRRTDHGSCNITTSGEDYLGGYYGATLLRPSVLLHNGGGQPMYCTYTFLGVQGQRVLFYVKKLIVGEYNTQERRCEGGFLRLWDGLRQPGRYPYPPNTLCGTYPNGQIGVRKFSTQHSAEVEFSAAEPDRHTTFTLTYKYVNIVIEAPSFPKQIDHHMTLSSSSVCQWRVVAEHCGGMCDLLSPGYPGIYPPEVECHYHVYTDDTMSALQLIFSGHSHGKPREFDLRETTGCTEDYLEIYDGDSEAGTHIGRFCGDSVPDITVSDGHLFMVFVSSTDAPPYGKLGFYGTAISLTKEWHRDGHKMDDRWCDWEFNASEGSVSSPDHWLPRDTTCVYTFNIHPGNYMEFMLTIYGLGPSCTERIEIWEARRLVVKICQSKLDKPQPRFTYNLTASPVRLKYATDTGQYQSTPGIGFWLSYRQIKGLAQPAEPVKLQDEGTNNVEQLTSVSGGFSQTSQLSSSVLSLTTCLLLGQFSFAQH